VLSNEFHIIHNVHSGKVALLAVLDCIILENTFPDNLSAVHNTQPSQSLTLLIHEISKLNTTSYTMNNNAKSLNNRMKTTLCLKKCTNFETIWLKIIRIDFNDIWQKYPKDSICCECALV